MESSIPRRNFVLPVFFLIAGSAICAGIGSPLSKPTFSSTGLIHIKPQVNAILFDMPNKLAPYEGFVATQEMLLKTQGVIDSALARQNWQETGRGNSPAEAENFRNHLDVLRDGEMLNITFHDADPRVALAGVKVIIGSYTEMYIDNDAENSSHQLHQLEMLRDQYVSRLKAQRDQIMTITGGLDEEILHARLTYKIQEQNVAESAWRQARRDLEEWKALNTATGTQPALSPADAIKARQLELHEEAAKGDYDLLNHEARELAQKAAEVQAANLDMSENRNLLDTTKFKIEQITVEAAQPFRISVLSNGDRPTPHFHALVDDLPGDLCFLLSADVERVAAEAFK